MQFNDKPNSKRDFEISKVNDIRILNDRAACYILSMAVEAREL